MTTVADPAAILPADYHSNPTRRAIADRLMAAVGADPNLVDRIDVSDTAATVWRLVEDRAQPHGRMVVQVKGPGLHDWSVLHRRIPVHLTPRSA